jgi:GNAT superfamily N-acetyltransferase
MKTPVATLAVRHFEDRDQSEVLDLLTTTLGGGPAGRRSAELFRWKHLENPFGRSILVVGETEGRIVGLRAFMRWRFAADGRTVDAVRAVDTATHPAFQRRGVFSGLTRAALSEVRGRAALVFNTPNKHSLPGYLKMGWSVVGRVPILVRVRHPLKLVRTIRGTSTALREHGAGGEPAADVLADEARVVSLLERIGGPAARLATPRTIEYLRWRYGAAPLLDYRAIPLEGRRGLGGLAIFRVRPRGRSWETTITELLVPAGAVSVAVRLLRQVVRATRPDHLTCAFPQRSSARRASRRAGFVRAPAGMTLVVNPLDDSLIPDPTDRRAWALSLGDLEVF